MKLFIYVYTIAVFLVGISCDHAPNEQKASSQKVLLISFDGFRADYLDKTDTPAFDALVRDGVRSRGMIPVFPTKTFPNHYSIVTGLYPENSGITGNTMYDPEFDATYRIGDREAVTDPRWYQGEPIWNTAEKQGLKAGTMFWVGSEAPVQNMRPTHWKIYDGRVPNEARVDTVINWLKPEGSNVDIATLYFSFTDNVGHRHGPDSPEIIEAIQSADELVAYLVKALKAAKLFDQTNIIFVSDHGMSQLSTERAIFLDEIIDIEKVRRVGGSPAVGLITEEDEREEIYQALKRGEKNYEVYRKEDLPERLHLKNHRRVPGLMLIADDGYTITTRGRFESGGGTITGGAHGYDNDQSNMEALFVAHGPAFKKGMLIEQFEVVHIYELMNHLLGTKPAKNDGDFSVLSPILN